MGGEISPSAGEGRCVLVARAKDLFASKLISALQDEQFQVTAAACVSDALQFIEVHEVTDAIVEIKLDGEVCFPLIRRLREVNKRCQVLVVTNYPSIATAVQAIKLGACDYLPMPVEPAEAISTLIGRSARRKSDFAEVPLSVNRMEWEHINRVLTEHRGNISAAARRLGMHRRTLQRKLHKHPVNQ